MDPGEQKCQVTHGNGHVLRSRVACSRSHPKRSGRHLRARLYQIVSGDFIASPEPGWETRIPDPILRIDIAAAANVDPKCRLQSASEFADRLRNLGQRRTEKARRDAELAAAQHAEQELRRVRQRRPWLIATAVTLLLGLCASLVFYRRAVQQRDIAEAINGFLSEDILTRASPYTSGSIVEPIADAIEQASPSIDRRFPNAPLVAAHLHQTVAFALDNRMAYPAAGREYNAAALLYLRAEGADSIDAAIVQLQLAAMHTRDTATPDHLQEAERIYQQEQPILAKLKPWRGDLPVWIDYAHGLIQMYESDSQSAAATFKEGIQIAQQRSPANIALILTMQQLLAVSETRLGDGADAEKLIRQMMETVTQTNYTGKPNLTNLGVNLAQAYMAEQKNREAIEEVNAVYPDLIKQMGETSDLSTTAIGVRAQAEASLGLWDDAARDSLMVYRIGGAKNPFVASGALSDAALYECRGGHFFDGETNIEEAYRIGKATAARNTALQGSFAFSQATCLIGLDKLKRAETLLSSIDVPAVAQMNADADWPVDVELIRAEIDERQGDQSGAMKQLSMARAACLRAGAAPFRTNWFHRLEMALSKPNANDTGRPEGRD